MTAAEPAALPAAEPPEPSVAAEPVEGAGAEGDLQDHEATQKNAATTPTEKDLENNAERTTMRGSVLGSPRVRAPVVP